MAESDSTDYYYQIPEYAEQFTSGTVASRMVDGLGFRYYWGTEGLRSKDLDFKPSEDARTAGETIDHILGLTQTLVNAVTGKENDGSLDITQMDFEEKRKATLKNIERASKVLRQSGDKDMENFKLIFKGKSTSYEYPFWNMINGPLADAIWHVGQVVSFRRSSGNPFNSKASLFNGRLRD